MATPPSFKKCVFIPQNSVIFLPIQVNDKWDKRWRWLRRNFRDRRTIRSADVADAVRATCLLFTWKIEKLFELAGTGIPARVPIEDQNLVPWSTPILSDRKSRKTQVRKKAEDTRLACRQSIRQWLEFRDLFLVVCDATASIGQLTWTKLITKFF